MEKTVRLHEAFYSFTQASKSLEAYYTKLGEKVQYLTQELESRNNQLKEAVSELSESKDFLQAVLQSIGEAIIVLDQDERVTMINSAARELYCLGRDEVGGMTFNDFRSAIKDSVSGAVLTVKGRMRDVIMSRSTVFDSGGLVRGYVIMIRDITELKEFERQNERNSRLIAMGEMAAKIVHEIRSPLCSVELFSTMLSDDLEGTSHEEMARGISAGIKSLNNILTNMLLFARNQKPAFREIKPGDAVEDSISMLAPLIEIRGVKVTKDLTDEFINGDPELLKQVFMNIILNAVQAMPDGGELKVSMRADDEFITVAVSDEGEGIVPENIEKIFDPFFSTKDRGTGLGLTIAHKITQCHDGFIKACINEDKGSTFRLYFPKIGHGVSGPGCEPEFAGKDSGEIL
ncbi:MAG: PAS domain S-box protein [Nitrospiraceae bacterium]|nr:MAG: PAS domain S-box protein [Nitrospiraceae bacterium]